MSSNADTPTTPGDDLPDPQYGEMMDALDAGIETAVEKVENGRIYDVENEKVRIKWIRALAYSINVRRQVANDAELAELSDRVERLEEARL